MPLHDFSAGGAGLTLINSTVLGADAANIDIQNIPGNFRALLILTLIRSTKGATEDSVRIIFNNDSGTNYDYQYTWGAVSSGGAQTAAAFAQTGLDIMTVPGASATSGAAGHGHLWMPFYAETTFHKEILTRAGGPTVTTGNGYYSESSAGRWRSTSAVTRVAFNCNGGNLLAGSSIAIYGV